MIPATALVVARIAPMEKTKMEMSAPTVTVPATVKTATVPEQQADPEIDKAQVTHLLDRQKEQLDFAHKTEFQVMRALWNLRGSYRLDDMVAWTGWSKQTIYNKWEKHGFKISDA